MKKKVLLMLSFLMLAGQSYTQHYVTLKVNADSYAFRFLVYDFGLEKVSLDEYLKDYKSFINAFYAGKFLIDSCNLVQLGAEQLATKTEQEIINDYTLLSFLYHPIHKNAVTFMQNNVPKGSLSLRAAANACGGNNGFELKNFVKNGFFIAGDESATIHSGAFTFFTIGTEIILYAKAFKFLGKKGIPTYNPFGERVEKDGAYRIDFSNVTTNQPIELTINYGIFPRANYKLESKTPGVVITQISLEE